MGIHPTLDHHELAAEALDLDHRDWIHDHHHGPAERTSEQAFDRLNPTFGVPADRSHRIGHHDIAQREAALALGVRVAVHDSRQNDPNPHVWQAGQDYRMADALQAARHQPTRTRWGRSGSAPNAESARARSTSCQRTTTPPSSATWSKTPNCGSPTTASPSPICGSR